jgi:adenylosuccinate lyase
MATENIMMKAVKRGGDRQALHEAIRVHSVAAGAVVKEEGLPNDLVGRIAADPLFGMTEAEIRAELNPRGFIGRAPEQVTEFLRDHVAPLLEKYGVSVGAGDAPELKV